MRHKEFTHYERLSPEKGFSYPKKEEANRPMKSKSASYKELSNQI